MGDVEFSEAESAAGVEYLTVGQLPAHGDGWATWLVDEAGERVVGPDGTPVAVVVTREGLGAIGREQVRGKLLASLRETGAS